MRYVIVAGGAGGNIETLDVVALAAEVLRLTALGVPNWSAVGTVVSEPTRIGARAGTVIVIFKTSIAPVPTPWPCRVGSLTGGLLVS